MTPPARESHDERPGTRAGMALLPVGLALIAVVLGMWWYGTSRPTRPETAPASPPTADVAAAAVLPDTAPAPPRGSAPDAAVRPLRSDLLTVRLLREVDGAPLAGAACRLARLDAEGEVAAEPARTGSSDVEGLLVFAWEAHDAGYELLVMDTDETRPALQVIREPGLVELRLPQWSWSVLGEAVTRDGAPVPGATARLWWASFRDTLDFGRPDLTVEVDAAGRFGIEAPASSGTESFVLCATAPGLMSAHALAGFQSLRDGPLVARLVLVPAVDVRVRVVDATGGPIAGAAVRLRTQGAFLTGISLTESGRWNDGWPAGLLRCHPVSLPAFEQRTGEDGSTHWTLTREAWNLGVAHAPQHPPWRDEVHGSGGDVQVVLHAGATLRGRVTDAAGLPVPRALARLSARSPHPPVETDADGAFRIDGIAPAEDAVLTVLGPEHRLHLEHLDVPPASELSRAIVLARGLPLAGRVLDAAGRAAPGVEVQIRSDRVAVSRWLGNARDRSFEPLALPVAIVTASDGSFRFGRLDDAAYRVRLVDARSLRVLGTAQAQAGDEDVLLIVGEGADEVLALTGRVTNATTGLPPAGALVQAERFVGLGAGQPWQLEQRFADPADGAYEFTDLDPGVWRLSVLDGRRVEAGPWLGPIAEYAAGRHEVPLRIDTAAPGDEPRRDD